MHAFVFEQPGRIVFGRGSLSSVGESAARLGGRALIVTGRRFAASSGYLTKLVSSLREAGLVVAVFAEVEPDPSISTVDRGSRLAMEKGIDVVLGFGGGSALDAAKAIAAVAKLGGSAEDHLYPKTVEDALPVVAVPTTTGTGSEVTRYSVLLDPSAGRKVVMQGVAIIPRVALLDPDVTDYMPGRLVAGTGFDALSHALEAFLSRRASPLSNLFAREAATVILRELSRAVEGDRAAREAMMYASMLAGVAINQAGTTMVHGLSYYLTVRHGVHHGVANALLLPYALEYYAGTGGKVDELANALGFGGWRSLVLRIAELEEAVGIPDSLAAVGVSPEELDRMVNDALQYRRNLENGPVVPEPAEVREVYEKSLRGRRTFIGGLKCSEALSGT